MTINHFADKTDINIYFHMKNHYKKIRNVKSTIDNSTPQGFIKAVSTPPNSERSWKTCTFEESHVRKCSHVPRHNTAVKKHSYSGGTKSDTVLRSTSLPPRPTTRRHPHEMPHKLQCKSRSQSTVQTSRKDGLVRFNVKKKKSSALIKRNRFQTESVAEQKNVDVVFINKNMIGNEDSTGSSHSKRKKSSESNESVNKSRLEEHEYLHFLLKITEDIILNNFYTNEDIEKVFQAHLEANKDHLKLEKMEAQLARLCVELNIPYKCCENELENKECYEKFFENCCLIPKEQDLTDCECTTIRALEIHNSTDKVNKLDNIIETEELNVFELENKIQNLLTNKCSLGRVSECTEPTNSQETLVNQTEQPSLMTISSFGNIDILPCFENMENSDQNTKETANQEEEPESLASQLFGKDPHLTVKEKFSCFEEDILFHKWKYDAHESDKLNDILDPNIENILTKSEDGEKMENINLEEVPYVTNIQGNSSEINILNEIEDPGKYLDNVGNYLNKNLTQVNNEIEYDNESIRTNETVLEIKTDVTEIKSTLDIEDSSKIMNEETNAIQIKPSLDVHDGDQIMKEENTTEKELISGVHEDIQIDESISHTKEEIKTMNENIPKDGHAQIVISSCDKESIANPKLKSYSKDEDYVLINGPVYILKSVLDSEEKLILYDNPRATKSDSFKEISPEKLIGESTIIPFNCFEPMSVIKPISEFDYVSFYLRKNNCTKLLNSDYDLMPQRDNNTSDKYHHLLVDATTSISNMHLTELVHKTNIAHDTLLLTDKYTLKGKKEYERMIEPENQTDTEDRPEQNYVFSNNETSVDGQYEIKSYSLPKEINGSVMLSGYSVSSQAEDNMQGSDQEIEVGMPLDEYEVKSKIASVGKEENGKVAVTIGSSKMNNNVESNVSTDTETSQSHSVRSEGERRSGSLCTNQKHILGKRKLEHPP